MSGLHEKRELNRGFGDGMSRAFELAVTPIVFGLLGWGLDSLLGTAPVLAIGLALFAIAGQFARLWYGYDAEMREHEANGRWNRTRPVTGSPVAGSPVTGSPDAEVDLWATTRRGAEGGERA